MSLSEQKVEKVASGLFDNHLFNPTDKVQWISKLLEDGLNDEDAKRAFKIAASRYHASRSEMKNTKPSTMNKLVKSLGYTGAGIFTFVVGPWMYLLFVLLIIAVLGFVFNF